MQTFFLVLYPLSVVSNGGAHDCVFGTEGSGY
jgi:hypothetical protein